MTQNKEQTSMFIQETGNLEIPRRSFKAFHKLDEAIKWIVKHPRYDCRLRQSEYTARDKRYIVNYKH